MTRPRVRFDDIRLETVPRPVEADRDAKSARPQYSWFAGGLIPTECLNPKFR